MVADENEFRHLTEQSNQLRFKNLRSLIDNHHRKRLHGEKRGLRLQRRGGSHDHAHIEQSLADGVELRLIFNQLLQEMAAEAWGAREAFANAQIVDARRRKHVANLIDGAVGVGGEKDGRWVVGNG